MIDINCDLGESIDFLKSGHDEALMKHITSANIACGFHAGDDYIMAKTVENVIKHNLEIGAHPGFNDKANFGRKEIELSQKGIIELVQIQLDKLQNISPIKLHHVKPHGALYNMSAKRKDYAEAIAQAVYEFGSNLILYGLSGSLSISAAQKIGLKTYSEVFADRAYLKNGSLAPRNLKGATLKDEKLIEKQIKALLNQKVIETLDDGKIVLEADTICVHSDSKKAVWVAEKIHKISHGLNPGL